MIISIRGTSGSGKSTIVRRVMDLYQFKVAKFIEGRKQPISYELFNEGDSDSLPLAVIGHYESPCGGCDTIHEFDDVFKYVRQAQEDGFHVLFEGVLLYCEIPRTIALAQEFPTTIIAMTTSIDVCIESINLRRAAKNPLKDDVDPKNTITKFNGTITSMRRLEEAGVAVRWCDREQAFALILKQFNLNPAYALL